MLSPRIFVTLLLAFTIPGIGQGVVTALAAHGAPLVLGEALYFILLPRILLHGPHGGLGDWRDPVLTVAAAGLIYS